MQQKRQNLACSLGSWHLSKKNFSCLIRYQAALLPSVHRLWSVRGPGCSVPGMSVDVGSCLLTSVLLGSSSGRESSSRAEGVRPAGVRDPKLHAYSSACTRARYFFPGRCPVHLGRSKMEPYHGLADPLCLERQKLKPQDVMM